MEGAGRDKVLLAVGVVGGVALVGVGCAAVEGVDGAAVRMVDLVRAVRVAVHAEYDEADSELFPNQQPSSQPKERKTSDELISYFSL